MKLKTLTLAVLAASMGAASVAHAEATAYGSIRYGLAHNSKGSTDVKNHGSRFGVNASQELDNGMSAYGKYEFGITDENDDDNPNSVGTRHAYVGLKGGFGDVRVGQTNPTFNRLVTSTTDNGWQNTQGNVLGNNDRQVVASYTNDMGPATIGATIINDGAEDGWDVAAKFDAGPVTVGLGHQDLDSEADGTSALSLSGKFGMVSPALVYTKQGDANGLQLHVGAGNAYFHGGQSEAADGTKTDDYGVGYTHSIGTKTTAWFELHRKTDESTDARAVLKYDF